MNYKVPCPLSNTTRQEDRYPPTLWKRPEAPEMLEPTRVLSGSCGSCPDCLFLFPKSDTYKENVYLTCKYHLSTTWKNSFFFSPLPLLFYVAPASGFRSPGTQKSRSLLFQRSQGGEQILEGITVQQAWHLTTLCAGHILSHHHTRIPAGSSGSQPENPSLVVMLVTCCR